MAVLNHSRSPVAGDLAAEQGAVRLSSAIFDLGSMGVLRLVGSDTRRFCNSMFTNDWRSLQVGHGHHNAMTDPKGRLMGLLDGWMLGDDSALLVLDGMDPEDTYDRLDMYIIMDPIELTRLEDSHGVLHLVGPDSEGVLAELGLPLPEADVAEVEGGWVLRNERLGVPGFDLVLTLARAQEIWDGSSSIRAGDEAFEGLRIEQGLPRWPVDMGERAFPHELGLRDRVCSFTKGCYIGQEVINRMETMGKTNRRLLRVELDAPGLGPVFVGDEPAGQVTSTGRVGDRVLGLGLLRKAAWEDGVSLRIND
jgi:folate-binding protein YgfZ